MDYFPIFFWSTLGILIAWLSVSIPSLFLMKFYLVIRKPYANKIFNSEGFEQKPEVLKLMLEELHDYLQREEKYEEVSEVKKIHLTFKQQKISISDVFDKVTLQTYIVGSGDMLLFPNRLAQQIDTYADGEDTAIEYGFLNIKLDTKLSIKEILKRILFG